MSVLVKGMEMPKNCFYCPMSHPEGKRLFCYRLHDEVLHNIYQRKVDPDCPLVELPPHGRLIDADTIPFVESEDGWTDDYVYRYDINELPTVIEAEVEE